jgi:Protein of unknown function (DUF2842)
MEPSWRKPFGIFAILTLIIIWSAMVLWAAPLIETTHVAAQAIIYLVLGIGWIAPLKPLLRWMETGRFR